MTNLEERSSKINNSSIIEKITGIETGGEENLHTPESEQAEITKAEAAAKGRVDQLIENVRGKLGTATKEVLSGIKAVFSEKTRQLRIEFEMRQAAKRSIENLEELTTAEATAHLQEIFGYQDVEFSREEATDIGKDIVQEFLVEHRHQAAEVRNGRNEYVKNNRFVFYAQNPQGERFSVEFFRQGNNFNSIDIRKLVSEPGEAPEYAEESVHLVVNPDGKFARGVISTGEARKLVPAGEAEVLLTGFLQDLQFDAEGTRSEVQRLRDIEVTEERIGFARALDGRLHIVAVGPEANTQIKVDLPSGESVELIGDPQQSYLELLDKLMMQNPKVAQAAGVTVTEV